MKNNFDKVIKNYKENLEVRLEKDKEERKKPMFSAINTDYSISKKISAISYGGIGLIDKLIKKMELPEMINSELHLLKRHIPYFESDHILNVTVHRDSTM